ncbi:MAG: ABC transporter ATP-binding protein [Acidobacteriota bacterium]
MSSTTIQGPGADRVVSRSSDAALLMRLLRLLQPYKGRVVVQLALSGLSSVATVVRPLTIAFAIDHALPASDGGLLLVLALSHLGLTAVEFFTRRSSLELMMVTGQLVLRDLRRQVFAKILSLDQSLLDRTPAGRLMVRATSDIDSLEELFSSGVVALISDLLKLAVLLGLMLWIHPGLTLAALLVAPAFLLVSVGFSRRIREAYRAVRARLSQLNAGLQEILTGIRVVRAFAQEKREVDAFERSSQDLLDDDLKSVRLDSVYSALVEMIASLAVAAVLWHGGGGVIQGTLTFGTLFVFLDYAQQFFTPLQDLSQKVAVIQSAMASSERVTALLDEEVAIRSPEDPPSLPEPRGELVLEDVSFAYDARPGGGDADAEPRPPDALSDVSLHLRSGTTVALVGPTGSGKTTITRLVSRLHDVVPGRGHIVLDGLELRQYPLEELRRRVAVVLQEPFLFSGSLRQSLFVGPEDDARAWEALEAVGLADTVREKGGLDFMLTERGRNLSAGQRQLACFARALLQDPALLILDEATASVDSLTERRVQAAVKTLLAGRSALVVAHRLSTIRDADEILVLARGRVVERGQHDDLLAAGGLYSRLHRLHHAAEDGA